MRLLASIIVDIFIRLFTNAGKFVLYLFGWRFIWALGRCGGDIVYSLNKKMRKTTKQELKLLFGQNINEKKLKMITKRSFENYYMRQIETVFFGSLNRRMLDKIVDAEGMENLEMALSKGKGVILLVSHFGSFLLPLPFFGYRGYKTNQITGKQIHTSIVDQRIWIWRKTEADKLPVNFIQADKFLKPLYHALKNNEIVAIAFDGRDASRWVTVDFFERKAKFSAGPFELARRTGSTIIPTFTIRQKNGAHKIVLESPFELTPSKDLDQAIESDVQKFSKFFAGYIKKHPSHFGMILYKLNQAANAGTGTPLFVEN